jgi:hypothetical protein
MNFSDPVSLIKNELNIRVMTQLELARAEFELAIWFGSVILNSFKSAHLVCKLSLSWLQLVCGSPKRGGDWSNQTGTDDGSNPG